MVYVLAIVMLFPRVGMFAMYHNYHPKVERRQDHKVDTLMRYHQPRHKAN